MCLIEVLDGGELKSDFIILKVVLLLLDVEPVINYLFIFVLVLYSGKLRLNSCFLLFYTGDSPPDIALFYDIFD